MDKEIKNEIEWTTKRGTTIKVESGLRLQKTINADGHMIDVDCCEKIFRVEVNGKYFTSESLYTVGYPKMVNGTKVLASLGRMYFTDQDDVDRVKAVVDKTESHPAWIAKMEKEAKAEKEMMDYEAHRAAVDKMMSY